MYLISFCYGIHVFMIIVFGGVFVLSRCFLDFSVGVWAFVIGLSHISSYFVCSLKYFLSTLKTERFLSTSMYAYYQKGIGLGVAQ